MNSMTIHGVDKMLADLIKAKAEAEGLSVNKSIKKLLETALGVKPHPDRKYLKDFEEFSGQWTESDLEEFETCTADLSDIDPGDWQ